ncbi:Holliday junction DNA helicase RuvA [Haloferula luteola]|uniref:Holliday junction branch migration complex subunit RuvA n=1 Tax=Haloferula luteola TaxID=595692 RepID=A0A840V4C9_9BACT|nr:Holliday junction branch migration protein RuvA [Haloferula luteola]MBB5351906.1 Holliday junction DNA helicase RuvA [Haloferula luteola]
MRGTVWENYPNRLVVDVGGIGYEVMVPLTSIDRLHPVEGMPIDLRVYHHQRENGQTLYGFATDEERDVFVLLIDRVSGIGPAIAMAILSGMAAGRFKACVAHAEIAELSRIKGLGKKTAERIVLELKDKVGVAETWKEVEAGAVLPAAADAELALVALGYKQVDARKAVKKILESQPGATTEELVRGALRSMA